MRRLDKSYFKGNVDRLINQNVPFTIEVSNKSYILRSRRGTVLFTDNFMSMDALNLTKRVKNYVIKKRIYRKYPKKTPQELGIKYLCFDKKYMGKKCVGIKELDLNTAFWITAKRLNIIDEEIFRKGMDVSINKNDKLARLVPLGTLAKKTIMRRWDGERYTKSEPVESSDKTRHLWDLITSKVDDAMKDCMKGLRQDFIFYWSDAVFVKGDDKIVKRAQNIIKKHDYTSKVIENAWYDFREDACYVYSLRTYKKGTPLADPRKIEEIDSLDYTWIRKNVDWKRQMGILAEYIEKGKQMEAEKEAKKNRDYIFKFISKGEKHEAASQVTEGGIWILTEKDNDDIWYYTDNFFVESHVKKIETNGKSFEVKYITQNSRHSASIIAGSEGVYILSEIGNERNWKTENEFFLERTEFKGIRADDIMDYDYTVVKGKRKKDKRVVLKLLKPEKIMSMPEDDFKTFVIKYFDMRNFCYSIDNEHIWKKRRKKLKLKK